MNIGPTLNDDWSIQEIWNELLTEDYPAKPRDYIRASEIGKPYLERYLSMKGVQPTNPFPARVKRIFDCGLIFEVDVVERIFRLLGILQDAQNSVTYEHSGLLSVHGRYDHKVGGVINVDQAMQAINDPSIPDWMKKRAQELLLKLAQQYPNGMRSVIAEIKSVNSMAFWAHKNIDPQTKFFKGYDHHKLQLYTYLLALDEAFGRLFYISKDDLTLMETSVYKDDAELKAKWEDDVATMTRFYREGIEPEAEKNIIFNKDKGVWDLNWRITRSPYFTLITGFKTPEAWESSMIRELKSLNSQPCDKCKKVFSLATLNKNFGLCGRCAKLIEQDTKVEGLLGA